MATQQDSAARRRVSAIARQLASARVVNEMRVAKEKYTRPTNEAELRVELAAAYRIVALLGWDDGIQNHITCKVPGEEGAYLINSYGLGFDEVTASSLVKIDVEGRVLSAGSVAGAVNLAGYNIHSALHKARPDAHCIVHTHEANVTAVASMKCGFLPGLSQHSMLCGEVPIHPYAPTTGLGGEEECAAMARDIGETSRALLLENHGVITCGTTISEAMMRLWYVTKASEIQVRALSTPNHAAAVNQVEDREYLRRMSKGGNNFFSSGVADAEFNHHRRLVDKNNPGYDDL